MSSTVPLYGSGWYRGNTAAMAVICHINPPLRRRYASKRQIWRRYASTFRSKTAKRWWNTRENARHCLLKPTFKGVWYAAVNFALWPLHDTRPDQCPRPHRRADDDPGYHGPGGLSYSPQQIAPALPGQ